MLCLPDKKLGALVPTYLFAECPEQIPKGVCFWLSRCYFDPCLLHQQGYSVIVRSWWKTLITDLTRPIERIYQSFDKKSTRYSLNVAQRLIASSEWVIIPPSPHNADDDALIADFYIRKQIEGHDFPQRLLSAPARSYWLTSRAVYRGETLLLRTYICDSESGIVRSLYAASKDLPADLRKDSGHISRWLCWQDIQHYKVKGYRIYDWGGISKHGELAGIDEFKKSFGGTPAVIHDALVCWRPLAPVLRTLWKMRFGSYPEVEDYGEK